MSCAAGALAALTGHAERCVGTPTLLLAAHPDDETIGAGSRLARLRRLTLAHLTDGAPQDLRDAHTHGFADAPAYAQVRRAELTAALAAGAARPRACVALGAADQQALRALVPLTRRLLRLLGATRAQLLITHAYEGGHPDHDAAAFVAHAACALAPRHGVRAPELIEMALYHGAGGALRCGEFIPAHGVREHAAVLDGAARARRAAMLRCYATQQQTLAPFLDLPAERLRPAPRYAFTRPPHRGPLHYERQPWGCTGPQWRAAAARAQRALGLAGAL